jgi:hypothetical protein
VSEDFGARFGAELRAAALPPASDKLRERVRAVTATPRPRSVPLRGNTLRWAAFAIVAVIAALAGALVFGSIGGTPVPVIPSPSPTPSARGSSSEIPSTVDGQPVLTVSQVLAQRAAGKLVDQPVVVAGYWSFPHVTPSCPETTEQPGRLEMYCYDGVFGIAERQEPITPGHGPLLTPSIDETIGFTSELYSLPEIDGQPFPPVPIVVRGHFDDPRAAECREVARQICKDRLVIDAIVQFDPRAVPRPSSTPVPAIVEGHPVLSVSQVLAQRGSGGLKNQPVVVAGFWSDASVAHSCAAPLEPTGDLEIYCRDGEFGITERDEPIEVIDPHGYVTPGTGPALTPYVDQNVDRAWELFSLPSINGQRYPPIPIVVLGHFDDPRAADCQSTARKLCRDRLVVDEIIHFDQLSVQPPAPTPSPTPFPVADPPPALFDTAACAEGKPVEFEGWKTLGSLGIDVGDPEATAYIVITRDPIVIGDWIDDPNGSGHRFRTWGQRVCYGTEGEPGFIGYTAMPGTSYREWDDGRHEPITP